MNAESYRLTATQRAMVAGYALDRTTSVDLTQIVLHFDEAIDGGAMHDAWRKVMQRHEVLRSAVDSSNPSHQVVSGSVEPIFQMHDWSSLSTDAGAQRLIDFVRADRATGLDIYRAPVHRIALIRCASEQWTLVWCLHHAFMDAGGAAQVIRDVLLLYDQASNTESAALTRPSPQFRDYVAWTEQQDAGPTEAHWAAYLAGATPTPLPFGNRVSHFRCDDYRERHWTVDPGVVKVMRETVVAYGITEATLLHAAWGAVLAHHADSNDVLFASVRSGRQVPIDDVAQIVGPLIFNVPVRVQMDWNADVVDWLKTLRYAQASFREREIAPRVSWQRLVRRTSGAPATSVLSYEPASLQTRLASVLGSGGRRRISIIRQPSFSLSVAAAGNENGGLDLRLSHYTDTLSDAEAEIVLSHFHSAFHALATGSARRVRQVLVLDDSPQRRAPSRIHERMDELRNGDEPEAVLGPFPEADVVRVSPQMHPRLDPVEELLMALWEDAFGLPSIAPTDHFFELGGDSILVTQIAARLESLSGVKVPMVDFFDFPVLRDLARHLSREPAAHRELSAFGQALLDANSSTASSQTVGSAGQSIVESAHGSG